MASEEAGMNHFIRLGLTFEEAQLLVSNGVTPAAAGIKPESVVPFVEAASFQGLSDINGRLLEADGNADLAWERWAEEEQGRE